MRMLGKLPPKHDVRTLQLAAYLHPEDLPAPPPARDWTHRANADWKMLANDRLGDCTCAAAAHLIQLWTANARKEFTASDQDVIAAYSAITGYDPARPETDQGAVELDVLRYWRTTGIAGHKIGAFAKVEPADRTMVEASVSLFGGLYIGCALPLRAQRQTIWDRPDHPTDDDAPGSWGGHAMTVAAYSRTGVALVTWGAIKFATWSWFLAYCDEAYAVLSPDWVDGGDAAPNGFDLAALQRDLAMVGRAA